MTTSPDALSAESIGTRLDRLRWSGTHLSILMALGAGWLFDSLEVNLVGSVINPLSEHFQATVEQSSRIFWVWLLGVLFGALAGGVLADRFGRRRLFLVTLLWYSGFTVLTAASPNLEVLYVLRFLTALGVGAEYGIINAAIMEFMPARVRGRSAAAVMNFWSIGAIASGFIAFLLLNTFALASAVSWRYGFALGGILALLVLFFRRRLPESPRWLAAQGRVEEAEAILRRMERRAGVDPDASVPGDAPEAPATTHRSALAELVRRYPGRLLLGCVLDLSEAFGYYGLSALLSIVVLKQVHYTDAEIPFFFILGNVGALIGGIGMTLAFDRLGRRWSVGTFYALAATGIGVLAAATSTGDKGLVLAATMLANAVATGAWTAAYPTFTELFPTHLRAAGIGTSVAVGRIGAAYGALYLPTLAVQIGATASYVLIAAFWSVGAIAMIVWSVSGGVDGARQPLSALSAGARGPAGLSPSAGPLTK
ncbi:MFS transporter [Microbispora amethystogenes]|uniref:Sugar transporter n=1 Tax=Microbispora amethystogenes TaxID=1427754 RepID=A0ABQ4FEQ1_9ACTN|nr:MFS transporter [Microbispora amethystogenes]GIH33278.1 sugar transporter [Microbispora amethystogenes]